jgi:hypothetical protein
VAEQAELPFEAPEDDPVSVYFASGLTGLGEDQLSIVELVSGLLSEFCSEKEIRVHQPVLTTDPVSHPKLTPEQVRSADYQRVTSSDALIVLADFPSWGGGIEVTWAERLRLPMLVLARREKSVSRLLRGTTADVQVCTWRFHGDLREAWKSFFLSRQGQMEAHRRVRAARQILWGPTLARFSVAYGRLSADQQSEVSAVAQLTARRIEEMLASPLAWSEASMDEVLALAGALNLPTAAALPGEPQVELNALSLSALQNAAELSGWSGTATMGVLRRAQVELARGGTRRLSFNEPQDWIDFGDHAD